MNNAFNDNVQSSVDTKTFLHSNDLRALHLKNEILYSSRLAMHLSMDKFVMADFDLETGADLEVSQIRRCSCVLNHHLLFFMSRI